MRHIILGLLLLMAVPAGAISESVVERQIEKAPEIKSAEELPQLVKKLTQKLRSDEEKAYILLTWIVKNVDYDEYKANQIEDSLSKKHSKAEIPSGDILKTRLGVCADIAKLYKDMLQEAGLQAVVIEGCVGEIKKGQQKCQDNVPGHSWNAVWIDKRWELVDPTWAMTGKQTKAMEDVTKKRKYEKELKKREKRSAHTYEAREDRRVDRRWFMTAPSDMKEDHHPFDEKWFLTRAKDRKNKNL